MDNLSERRTPMEGEAASFLQGRRPSRPRSRPRASRSAARRQTPRTAELQSTRAADHLDHKPQARARSRPPPRARLPFTQRTSSRPRNRSRSTRQPSRHFGAGNRPGPEGPAPGAIRRPRLATAAEICQRPDRLHRVILDFAPDSSRLPAHSLLFRSSQYLLKQLWVPLNQCNLKPVEFERSHCLPPLTSPRLSQ
jgi:hypothetical protein